MKEKAVIATIDYGFAQVEGLCHPTEGYGIAVPQICEFMSFDRSQGSRTIKRTLGKDFQFDQWASVLHPKAVNVLRLSDFALLCYLLGKRGNAIAESFVLAAIEETHERRFDTAFGKVVEESEYNERLKLRMKRLLARRDWTDVLMERFVDIYGIKPTPHDYKRWTILVNRKLFNRDHFHCDRDNMTQEQQEIIYDFERMARRRSIQHPHVCPDELVLKALDTF